MKVWSAASPSAIAPLKRNAGAPVELSKTTWWRSRRASSSEPPDYSAMEPLKAIEKRSTAQPVTPSGEKAVCQCPRYEG